MKCLYLLPKMNYFSSGSRARVTHALGVVEGLYANDVEVVLLSGPGLKSFRSRIPQSTTIVELPAPLSERMPPPIAKLAWILALIWRVPTILRATRPDIFLTRYSAGSLPICALLLRYANCGYRIWEVNALTMHRPGLKRAPAAIRRIGKRLEGLFLQAASHIYTLSDQLRSEVQEALGRTERPILVVPNGANRTLAHLGRDSRIKSEAEDSAPSVFKFVYLGSLYYAYDFGTMIDAFTRMWRSMSINNRSIQVELCIYGEGDLQQEVSRWVHRSSAPISMPGRYDLVDVARTLSPRNAVALLPRISRTLGTGLKVYEYMALGLPILATDIPEFEKILSQEVNALLYPPGDVRRLAVGMETMVFDPALRTRLGESASEHFLRSYTWDARMRKLLELL